MKNYTKNLLKLIYLIFFKGVNRTMSNLLKDTSIVFDLIDIDPRPYNHDKIFGIGTDILIKICIGM